MNLCSDNTAGISPPILAAISACNVGHAMPYGNDPLTEKVLARFKEVFETDCTTFLTGTGTSANALALASLCPPFGSILCHRDAHIEGDECGAPEMFTGGAKLVLLQGEHGKIDPQGLESALLRATSAVHHVQPRVLSLSNLTEAGTAYTPDEIKSLCEIAHRHGLKVHMDGARFSNVVAASPASAAELTWKAGLDVLSFGATKNGAMAAEAVVFFDPSLAADFGWRRKRAGHLFSKMRFVAAQWDTFLEGDHWLDNARHSNAMARKLAEALGRLENSELIHPVDGNEIFIKVGQPVLDCLDQAGVLYYRWEDGPEPILRLVTSFNTSAKDMNALVESLEG